MYCKGLLILALLKSAYAIFISQDDISCSSDGSVNIRKAALGNLSNRIYAFDGEGSTGHCHRQIREDVVQFERSRSEDLPMRMIIDDFSADVFHILDVRCTFVESNARIRRAGLYRKNSSNERDEVGNLIVGPEVNNTGLDANGNLVRSRDFKVNVGMTVEVPYSDNDGKQSDDSASHRANPPRVGDISAYALRSSDHYLSIDANTSSYAKSFLPSTTHAWNSLPNPTKNATTLASFKRLITHNTPKILEYFYSGDRIPQILHTRLRTECSALNSVCSEEISYLVQIVGELDSNNHFLLACPRFNLIRVEMLSKIRQFISPDILVTTRLLLQGDSNISVKNNIRVFKEVQTFITKTNRFVVR